MEALTSYTMRDFLNQPEPIDFIIKSLALDPKLNKHSLSLLLCKKYSFISPSGEMKLSSCQAVVSDLVKNKKITLEPLLKHKGKFNSMVLSSVNHPLPNNLPANVQEIKNEIEIILIARDGDDDKKQIWNDIIGKEHYLGVTRPVGYIVNISLNLTVVTLPPLALVAVLLILKHAINGWVGQKIKKNSIAIKL